MFMTHMLSEAQFLQGNNLRSEAQGNLCSRSPHSTVVYTCNLHHMTGMEAEWSVVPQCCLSVRGAKAVQHVVLKRKLSQLLCDGGKHMQHIPVRFANASTHLCMT